NANPTLRKVCVDLQALNSVNNARCVKISHATEISLAHLITQRFILFPQIGALVVTAKTSSVTKQCMRIGQVVRLKASGFRGLGNLLDRVMALLSETREQLKRQLRHVALYRRSLFDALKHVRASNIK